LLYQSAQLAFLGPPSTAYSHSAILFSIHVFLRQYVVSVSSRAILFSNLFFLRHSHVSVTNRAYRFSNHVFHRHPPAKFKMAAALIYLLHGWGSGILFYQSSWLANLRPSLTTYPHRGNFFFQLRLQALTRLGYIPRHLVYQPRLFQALPRLRFLRPQP